MKNGYLNTVGLYLLLIGLASAQSITFAAIGDFGKDGSNLNSVANLIKGWNPEFIITLGDNNYENGEASTIDRNIGKYFADYIYPYTGSYSSSATENKFFPSLGNHDWYTANAQPHIDYFTLPNNERYYEFVKGNVHFFVIDSDSDEPDGRTNSSVQAQWIRNKVQQSTATWKVAYFHHASYSSGSHGSQSRLQWDFEDWGIDVVMAGHDHHYERIHKDDNNDGKEILYFVNGLGGKSRYSVGGAISGSKIRYNSEYGAMKVTASSTEMTFKFINIQNNEIDSYTLTKSSSNNPPTLNPIANVSLEENATEQTISLTGISDGDAGLQTLTLSATSSNTGLIPNPTITYSQQSTTGTLTFTPASGQTGTATITVTIQDNGSENTTTQRTFTVTVQSASGANTYEPNNTFSEAKPLPIGETLRSYIQENGDVDVFYMEFDGVGALKLELKNFPGDYDMYLYNSSQQEIAEAYTTKDPETIEYTITSAGRYYVKVDGYKSAYSSSDDYELTATYIKDNAWDNWVISNQVIESAHNYSNYTDETKSYSHSGAQKVAVHFVRLETEKNYDFVYIKDKNQTQISANHGDMYDFWAIVDGDEIHIQLKSDHSVTDYGYVIDKVGYFMGTTSAISRAKKMEDGLLITGKQEKKPLPIDMFAQKHKETRIPTKHAVSQAYPNPFNPSTTITVDLHKTSPLKVDIINVLGQTVEQLYQGTLPAGKDYKFTWNAHSANGIDVSSNVYFFRVLHEHTQTLRKVVLIK